MAASEINYSIFINIGYNEGFNFKGRKSMQKGTVKWFNYTKGYGFITPEDQSKDIFVHRSEVEKAGIDLKEGQEVKFELQTNKGKQSAVNLQVSKK